MLKKWKTALRIVLLVVAGAVVGTNLYSWNAKSLMGNSLPMPFGCGGWMCGFFTEIKIVDSGILWYNGFIKPMLRMNFYDRL